MKTSIDPLIFRWQKCRTVFPGVYAELLFNFSKQNEIALILLLLYENLILINYI